MVPDFLCGDPVDLSKPDFDRGMKKNTSPFVGCHSGEIYELDKKTKRQSSCMCFNELNLCRKKHMKMQNGNWRSKN